MWKSVRKEDERPVTPVSPPATSTNVPPAVPPKEVKSFMETPKISDSYRADVAHIGKSVLVKGELSGSEDLYLDGEVEGSIDLKGHSLTIGPNGRVRANVNARDVVVHGKVEGNLRAADRVELKKSAILMGDIFTQRIVIEDGAFFKGGIDIQQAEKNEPKSAAAAASVASPVISHTPVPSASPAVSSVAAAPHAALLEPKKF
jgi:cytoskeletal protein CcmA (bactofilin family)